MNILKRKRETGNAIITSLIAMALFQVLAYMFLVWAQDQRAKRFYEADSAGLREVQRALTQYARANQAAFKAGKTIMYVNNQYAPTIAELQSLGFLTSNSPEIVSPWGSTFSTKLSVAGTGAVSGGVFLMGNINDSAGNPDRVHACNVAKALRELGMCTPPNNAAMIGNLYTQTANPSGQPAAVGALVSIPP